MEARAGNLPVEGEVSDPSHGIQQNADASWSNSGTIPLDEADYPSLSATGGQA
ncbi:MULTISPECIES: hypothetical protein [unclassified Erwinia]|uniref:hypothetical protein n=1 Tax=unclassified Erwinia TaxID=2622719 RepID=UPI001304291F|nr:MULTISPECIES: hypothetical protein [unclassified Erwinia]